MAWSLAEGQESVLEMGMECEVASMDVEQALVGLVQLVWVLLRS